MGIVFLFHSNANCWISKRLFQSNSLMLAVPQNTGNIVLLNKALSCISLSAPMYLAGDCHEHFVINTSNSKQRQKIKLIMFVLKNGGKWFYFRS